MIAKIYSDRKNWSPDHFAAFYDTYPHTQWDVLDKQMNRSDVFNTAWQQQSAMPEETAVVLTPGLFAEGIPSCFKQAHNGFIARGHRCLRTSVSTRHSVSTQAASIEQSISTWLKPQEQFIWCTHSKGGIDALWALEHYPQLRSRCLGLIMVQLPVGHSWVIEDIRHRSASWYDQITKVAMNSRWFRHGIDAVSQEREIQLQRWLRKHKPTVPAIHAISWSVQPTSWADSWHKRLTKLRPLHAHDGQFFMQDQRLEQLPLICLPRLDHAQPVLGGNGLDCARLWAALSYTASVESQAR